MGTQVLEAELGVLPRMHEPFYRLLGINQGAVGSDSDDHLGGKVLRGATITIKNVRLIAPETGNRQALALLDDGLVCWL